MACAQLVWHRNSWCDQSICKISFHMEFLPNYRSLWFCCCYLEFKEFIFSDQSYQWWIRSLIRRLMINGYISILYIVSKNWKVIIFNNPLCLNNSLVYSIVICLVTEDYVAVLFGFIFSFFLPYSCLYSSQKQTYLPVKEWTWMFDFLLSSVCPPQLDNLIHWMSDCLFYCLV